MAPVGNTRWWYETRFNIRRGSMRASDNGLESSLVGVCARTKHLDRYRIALSELGKLHVVDRRARKRGLGGSPWDRPRASLSLQQDSPVRRDDGRCFRDYVIPEAQTNDRWLRNFWKCAEEETVRFGSVSVWKFHRSDDEIIHDKKYLNLNLCIVVLTGLNKFELEIF